MLRADFNRISSHIYFQDKNNSSFCKQNSAWQRIFTEEKGGVPERARSIRTVTQEVAGCDSNKTKHLER